ncbi:CPBP family intramembrane metalloprotease [Erysipelothrix sp. HDW6C]|uniref:CPBP family intramembrane glutamic endopeptidase n=1 Tax=Erysipelothrix sp. HDW6C TaxID=2714930 RepID=UPI00140CEEB1|nr:CPBP family intramembrane glutamic endopeptidase [Erysipelothrix sp. HDW6C]QIK69216.1 CPBP family intramembrane metalloprotease [Erysipelothrix sp. HDW6C]
MNKNFMKALGFSLLMLVFPIISSIIIQVMQVTDDATAFVIQAVAFGIAAIIGLGIMRRMKLSLHVPFKNSLKDVLWFLPLIVIEVLGLVLGFQTNLSVSYVLSLLIFTICVGISEEVFFRGIVLRILERKNKKYAVIVSSIFFGILHLANLAGGVSIEYALLQVVFAFLFGFISANLVVITKSLLPVIIWHFTHDFISFMSGDTLNSLSLMILGIQCIIMIVYSIYLWKKLPIQK